MKQVIVVNEALALPRGKLAAQVAHASIGAFLEADGAARRAWLADGMTKIVVGCESSTELDALEALARAAGLPVCLVVDAGRTVVASGTQTCLGIGPSEESALRPITGALTLVR